MSTIDKRKRFDSLMPIRTEVPPHKSEVIEGLMGGSIAPSNEVINKADKKPMIEIEDSNIETSLNKSVSIEVIPNVEKPGIEILEAIEEFERTRLEKVKYDELYSKHTFVIKRSCLNG